MKNNRVAVPTEPIRSARVRRKGDRVWYEIIFISLYDYDKLDGDVTGRPSHAVLAMDFMGVWPDMDDPEQYEFEFDLDEAEMARRKDAERRHRAMFDKGGS